MLVLCLAVHYSTDDRADRGTLMTSQISQNRTVEGGGFLVADSSLVDLANCAITENKADAAAKKFKSSGSRAGCQDHRASGPAGAERLTKRGPS
jgi:hypothetical protein